MTRFFKLSAGGNDFIGLLEPKQPPDPVDIAKWCRRGISIGADGIFVLTRQIEGIRLDYWNSDGGEADFCGNAARCAVRLAHDFGWIGERINLLTPVGTLAGRIVDSTQAEVEAPLPTPPQATTITTSTGSFDGWSTTVGVPHFVILGQEDIELVDVMALAPAIRSHEDFGASGTNVDWVAGTKDGSLGIRSFERGVEAETLACGSGVLAAAAASIATGSSLPLSFLTRSGFTFEVNGTSNDRNVTGWRLAGDARLVASGILESGSTAC